MKLVALTGGIGSGKSVVAGLLAERGAVVIDADAIVHELQVPGAPLLDVLAERFGDGIIRPDGSLDRAGLAAIAFHDDAALADLNEIVHPAVRAEIAARIEAEQDTDHVVVVDTPLLTVTKGHEFAAVLVVDLPVDLAVERLVGLRGMDEQDAKARIAKQMSRDERLAKADRVIDNSGDLAALAEQVDEVWDWLQALPTPAASRQLVRWLTVFIDRPAATFDAAAQFWPAVTGSTLSPSRGEHGEFATAIPGGGDSYVRLQRLGHGPARLHLDVHVDDVRAVADLAVSLGATELADVGDVVVMSSPAGLPWCVVAHDGGSEVPPPTSWPDGSRTRVEQVCIDVAPERFDAECAFWSALTGWTARAGARAEYRGLDVPIEIPLRVLFQRQEEVSPDHDASAHLDVFCSDVDAAAEHHRRLGAELLAEFPWWKVMRDPTGEPYCLIRRDPGPPA